MRNKFILATSVVVLIVVLGALLCSCSTSTTLTEKDYDKQVEYYDGIKKDIISIEEKLDVLMDTLKDAKFSSNFMYERYYYSTAENNVSFKGTQTVAGYNNNSKTDGTKWMVESINYEFKYDNGSYYIKATPNTIVDSDAYDKGSYNAESTYSYLYKSENSYVSGGETDVVEAYASRIIDVLFGDLISNEYLEKYGSSAEKGFRLYTSMMQYQTVKAYAYANDGSIDKGNAIEYTANKDLIKYSALTEVWNASTNSLSFSLNDAAVDIAGSDVSYWDNYSEDISYNFYKIAAVQNDKVTITYSNGKDRVDSYEYYNEIVLPFYTKKSKFQTYNVLKSVVADYTHFVVSMDYKTEFSIPDTL